MECVTPPLVPVIVIGKVPVGAFLATVSVKSELPAPVMEVGLKLPVTPVGIPVAVRAMAESNPPVTLVETTAKPLWPCSRKPEVGETEMANVPVGAAVTVSETVAVWVMPPPVPVTVMVYVPVAVVEVTASVSVDVPEPGAAMEAGLRVAVTPVGAPVAVKAIAELKPPETVVVSVDAPLLPCTTETDAGEAASVKAGVATAVTVSEIVAEWVMLSPLPVTVMLYVPVAVVEATAKVTVEVPEPGAAIDVGLKLTVTPVGAPVAVSAIAELKPPETAVVMLDVPLLPTTTETEVGDTARVKAGVALPGARALIRLAPFGLPQPVTRS